MSTFKSGDGWKLTELEDLGVTELHRTADGIWEGQEPDLTATHAESCADPNCDDVSHR